MSQEISILHALSTAIISYGGFPIAPEWFRKLTNTKLGQVLVLTNLIYSIGGRLNFMFSLIFAIVFYALTLLMKNIHVSIKERNEEYRNFVNNYL